MLNIPIPDISPDISNPEKAIISQGEIILRIISIMHIASYLLIIIGLIVSIVYMIKSKKRTINKFLISIVIILVLVIINIVLGLLKTNMLLNDNQNLNFSNNISNNNLVMDNNANKDNLGLWINNYKQLQSQQATFNLNLFGNKQTTGIATPIDINKLNAYTATYVYYPYESTEKVKISNLNDINNIAVSTVYVHDKNNSLLFIIELNGQGLTFKECIEQGKFIIHTQGNLLQGSMNISASQLGLDIQNEDFEDQSNILDAITNNCGTPTYIVADKSLEELKKETMPSIHYKLVYQYSKYVVALYVQENIVDNEKKCEIRYIYYYPIEKFNNNVLTDNNSYSFRIK